MSKGNLINFLFLYFFSSALLSPVNAEIPQITDQNFEEIVHNNTKTPMIVNFYVENCMDHRSNGYLNLLSTWEALYQEMNGDFYKFYNSNMYFIFIILSFSKPFNV